MLFRLQIIIQFIDQGFAIGHIDLHDVGFGGAIQEFNQGADAI
ncbi:MAG: hypothetical protein RIQ35_1388, partial [Pseudomonadota bacterium]